MNRSQFVNKLGLAYLSYFHFKILRKIDFNNSFEVPIPLSCCNLPSKSSNGSDYFIDMHCHPSLKLYLWGKKIWRNHPSRNGCNILNMQVDVNKVLAGNVRGLLTAHYLPERGLKEQSKKIRKLFPLLKFFAPVFASKIEEGGNANFRQISVMLDEFEQQVKIANIKIGITKTGKDIIKIARSYKEFEDNINAGIISVAQTIEGAHALGSDINCHSAERYLNNLDRLFERGICLMTIAHFFQNDLSFSVEGMPPWDKAKLNVSWKYHPELDDKPLTPIGKSIVKRMLEIGMVVDITHLTPKARSEIFLINERFNRPIVFSHSGVQSLFNGPEKFKNYKYYCASDDEIGKIKKCNGVIGLIFMTYFLVGRDTHTEKRNRKQLENGIDYIVETIEYIRKKTGTYENIALGSDFDNLAGSPADLKDASSFPVLLKRIRKIPFIKQEEVDMITHGNALRVLREGWKR